MTCPWTTRPKDFTPVCTTDLGYMAGLKEEFAKRNCKVIGLSVDSVGDDTEWAKDIEETQGNALNYPLIGDTDLAVAKLFDMIHPNATGIEPRPEGGFCVSAEGQPTVDAPFVLLSTGMVDIHLDIPGYMDFWGKSLVHCPYCHGWEFRDRPLGVLAPTADTLDMGPLVTHWSQDVVVFANPELEIPEELERQMEARQVVVERRRIRRIAGSSDSGMIEAIELEDGARIPRAAVYYRPKQCPHDVVQALGPDLGMRFTDEGFVEVDGWQQTSVGGIYAAGDLVTVRQQIVVATAQGFMAALAIELALKQV